MLFVPHPALRHPLLQTLSAHMARVGTLLADRHLHVSLPDGDGLVVLVNHPTQDSGKARVEPFLRTLETQATAPVVPPVVVLIPGLGASAQSAHIVRLTQKLLRSGFRVYRLNPRGLGEGLGLARQVYHAARNDDVGLALQCISRDVGPHVSMVAVGLSLGGNMLLAQAGRAAAGDTKSLPRNLRGLVALSPILNLAGCAQEFGSLYFGLVERVVTGKLRKMARARHTAFPDLGPLKVPRKASVLDFELNYTLPQTGFEDLERYYEQASAAPWLSHIRLPAHVIISRDDPLAIRESFQYPSQIASDVTSHGGHLGFLSQAKTPFADYFWSDWRIVQLSMEMLHKESVRPSERMAEREQESASEGGNFAPRWSDRRAS